MRKMLLTTSAIILLVATSAPAQYGEPKKAETPRFGNPTLDADGQKLRNVDRRVEPDTKDQGLSLRRLTLLSFKVPLYAS